MAGLRRFPDPGTWETGSPIHGVQVQATLTNRQKGCRGGASQHVGTAHGMFCLARAFYILVRGCHWLLSLVPSPSGFPMEGTLGSAQEMWLCVVGLGASLLGLAGSLLGDSAWPPKGPTDPSPPVVQEGTCVVCLTWKKGIQREKVDGSFVSQSILVHAVDNFPGGPLASPCHRH